MVRTSSPQWIATRVLQRDSPKGRVLVRIGHPQKVAHLEWRVEVEIRRGRTTKKLLVHGLDSFQAIIASIQAIGYELDKDRPQIMWEGGEPGEHGFPLYLPEELGRDFSLNLRKKLEVQSGQRLSAGRRPKAP